MNQKEGQFPTFFTKEELKTCIERGFGLDASSKNLDDLTPLIWASSRGLVECVKILLELKADPNIYNTEGNSSALRACTNLNGNRSIAITKLLISYGADINSQTKWGSTVFHEACYWNNKNIAKLLINARADLEIRDFSNQTLLHRVINKRYIHCDDGIITFLLNNGAKIPPGEHDVSKKVSATIRKLKCIKRVLITFCALSKKTGAIHKDLRNPIAKMVWETREDEVWDQKEYFDRDLKMRKIE
jgi:Ankyrin repeats (3 copies)/Ankyrin repeat